MQMKSTFSKLKNKIDEKKSRHSFFMVRIFLSCYHKGNFYILVLKMPKALYICISLFSKDSKFDRVPSYPKVKPVYACELSRHDTPLSK